MSGDDSLDLVTLGAGTLVLTETRAGHLDSLLFLGGDLGTEGFNHLALIGSEAGNLVDNLTDSGDTGVQLALSVDLMLFECIVDDGGFGNDVTLVMANSNSSLLLHLISLK